MFAQNTHYYRFCLLGFLLIFCLPVHSLEFSSGDRRVALIELYTSEGCSSCPPADRWLTSLKTNPYLWKRFVPVAFHVDYWDYLGWKDRFSDPRFTTRQYDYRRYGHVSAVYTPGVMLNGREWRKWRRHPLPDISKDAVPGNLSVALDNSELRVAFNPVDRSKKEYVHHVALLQMGRVSEVRHGENRGSTLGHDFVVSQKLQVSAQTSKNRIEGVFANVDIRDVDAIAVWVSETGDPTPIQAVGRYLKRTRE